MDLNATLAVMGACAAIAAFCGWRGSRPWNPLQGPRLVPWSLIMLLAFTGLVLSLGELAALLGLRPVGPR